MKDPASYDNLAELFDASCRRYAERPLFGEHRDGEWRWTTYAAVHDQVADFRAGLAHLGVVAGDRVAIVAGNGVRWAVSAYAAYGLGASFVPMYEAQHPDEWCYILRDCKARVLIASSPRVAAAIEAARATLPDLAHVIVMDAAADDPSSFAAVLAEGRAHPMPPPPYPAPDSVAGFVYTSGTTGKPKGVILTHENLASNVAAATLAFPIEPTDRTLSFLPWAHAYGQVVEVHILISCGASTAICRGVDRLAEDLVQVKPTILVAVPRIFNKIYDAVMQQVAARARPIRALFRAGVAAALARARGEHLGWRQRLMLWLADRLMFSKVRARFGGHLRYAISASATLSLEVAQIIDAFGIPVYEGYGLTETSPVVATNRPGARRMGSVGRAIPGVTVRIEASPVAEPGEGEIVVYGPNVMRGYHGRDEETAEVLRADGGLRTGDLGRLDSDGYLYITGRLKEQYKLENGKYVMPGPLEEQLALSPFITTVMLYGAGRPYNVALVAIDVAAVRAWGAREGIALPEDLTTSESVRALIGRELEQHAAAFRSYERPRAFVLVTDEFTIAGGLLTPSLKLKRKTAVARYGALLEALYPTRPAMAKPAPVTRLEPRARP